jgi:hypothetical protein
VAAGVRVAVGDGDGVAVACGVAVAGVRVSVGDGDAVARVFAVATGAVGDGVVVCATAVATGAVVTGGRVGGGAAARTTDMDVMNDKAGSTISSSVQEGDCRYLGAIVILSRSYSLGRMKIIPRLLDYSNPSDLAPHHCWREMNGK